MNAFSEAVSFLLFGISLLPYPRITLTLLVTAFNFSFHYLFWPLNPSIPLNVTAIQNAALLISMTYILISRRLNLYLATLKLQLFKGIHILDQQLFPSLFSIPHIHVIAKFYHHPGNIIVFINISKDIYFTKLRINLRLLWGKNPLWMIISHLQ